VALTIVARTMSQTGYSEKYTTDLSNRLEMLVREKRSSLLDPLVSYAENEVL
jgi:hypothetical protein